GWIGGRRQKSRWVYVSSAGSSACARDCPFGPEGLGTWYAPPPGKNGRWHEDRDDARRRCLDCPQYPVLGVLGVGCRREEDLASVETPLLESFARRARPGAETPRLSHDLSTGGASPE